MEGFLPDLKNLISPEMWGSILRSLIVVAVGLPIAYAFSRWIRTYGTKKFSAQQGMVFGKIVFYLIFAIVLMSVLNEFGFKFSTLLGAAGILGIAIGFASQTSMSNVISGLFLIAEKPFEVNDVITVGNFTGIVLSIDTMSVKMRTFDNRFVRIPNETLVKSEVINITRFPIRRVDLTISVAYKEDLEKVQRVLMEIARDNPLCLNDPAPLIILNTFGASGIDLLYLVWAAKEDWLQVKNGITLEVKKRFDAEGIEIPFPHVSLYTGTATAPMPVKIVEQERQS